ncbi:MAG: hypothetical protein AAF251_15395 [Pseudomonadota bacterium]
MARLTNRRGGRARLALVTWTGVYPVLTLIALALEPVLSGEPVMLRTLIMSALMVPVMVFIVMPTASRAVGDWIDGAPSPSGTASATKSDLS